MTEHKSLVGRWVLIALVVGAALAAFWSHISPSRPFGLTLGQDLRGGTTLRFSLDLDAARKLNRIPSGETDAQIVKETLAVIETRVNRFGLAEINITPIGDDKFEISIPSEVDADSIKKVVAALGELQFRIEVKPFYDEFRGQNGETRVRNQVWTGAGEFEATPDGFQKFKEAELAIWKKAREAGVEYKPSDARYKLVPREETARATVGDFVVVEEPEAGSRLGGDILTNIRPGPDGNGGPGVHFDVKTGWQGIFHEWTSANVGLPMSILLNGEYHSAPVINSPLKDNVVITLGGGSMFGAGAAEAMKRLVANQKQLVAVLQSGSLKVQPVAEAANTVGPTLAGQAVQRGLLSTLVAFALVLLYMGIYYFAAGMIANVALLLNLVLLVGAMAFLEGTLTLPGIAGIVLTLGMAVDANILIYERIREEQARGRSVARAVGEGFDRAFTTIVDSNVTTFLTALFLYMFGTGAIKGFAVTLSLGLLASMFTAVYVTRTIFEAWVRGGKVQRIRMLGSGKAPSIRWMRLRRLFIPASIAVMVMSLGLFFSSKDETIYDIDFTGGMKLQARFARPTSIDEVKKALDGGAVEVAIPDASAPPGAAQMKKLAAGPYGDSEVVTVGAGEIQVEMRHPLALSGSRGAKLAEREQLDAYRAYVTAVMKDRLLPPWVMERPAPYTSTGDADVLKEFDGRLRFEFALEDPKSAVTASNLKAALEKMPYYDYMSEGHRRTRMASDTVRRRIEVKDVARPAGATGDAKVFEIYWKSDKGAAGTSAEMIPDDLLLDLKGYLGGPDFKSTLVAGGVAKAAADAVVLADPFPVNDLIGAGVAKRMRDDALLALLLSFAAIVVYVAFRFRSYAMGFSAVLCLVHDVVIALGLVCLADQLGVIDAKINLGLVAAFLTLVGYSVNDTVVTFDRIRELRGKAPRISSKMIEDAINQTLARTIRTSVTVFLTLIVLFAINVGQRSLLEGLSFTLLVGVIIGTYSSIGIASPLLLFLPWFWTQVRAYRPRAWAATWPTRKPYGWVLVGVAVAAAVGATVVNGNVWFGIFWGLLMVPLLATAGFWLLWALAFSLGSGVAGALMVVPWSFRDDHEQLVAAAIESPTDGVKAAENPA